MFQKLQQLNFTSCINNGLVFVWMYAVAVKGWIFLHGRDFGAKHRSDNREILATVDAMAILKNKFVVKESISCFVYKPSGNFKENIKQPLYIIVYILHVHNIPHLMKKHIRKK